MDPTFLDFQVPRSPNYQISKFPDFQAPRFANFQIPRLPDSQTTPAAPAPAPDEPSDPNLAPLPMHPGIKYVARSLCCDIKELNASAGSRLTVTFTAGCLNPPAGMWPNSGNRYMHSNKDGWLQQLPSVQTKRK